MIGLRSLITFVFCSLFLGASNAFTVLPSATKTTARIAPMNVPQVMSTSTSRPALPVDGAIVEMVSRSDPIGAIAMAVLVISLWEIYTPGRVKK
jgi:hypothetical protein